MELPKLTSYLTVLGLGIGLFLNITFGIWNLSELFYRVNTLEVKQAGIELREEADRKANEQGRVETAQIATKIDNVRDILDKILDRGDAPVKK